MIKYAQYLWNGIAALLVVACFGHAAYASQLATVAPLITDWQYYSQRCDQPYKWFSTEGEALNVGATAEYGGGSSCGWSVHDPSHWGTTTSPQSGTCGSDANYPIPSLGVEAINARDYSIHVTYPNSGTSPCSSSFNDGLVVYRVRNVSCPSGYAWNGTACALTAAVDPDKNNHQCSSNGTNPIHTALGTKLQTETDFVLPGVFPVRFDRYYSSARSGSAPQWEISSLGPQWRNTYDRSIHFVQSTAANTAYVLRHDGDRFHFNQVGSTASFTTDSDVAYVLTQTLDGGGAFSGWKLVTPEDQVELYNTDGQLQSITDRNGRTITMGYNTNGQLTQVQDDAGRAVILAYKTYQSGGGTIQPTVDYLSSITLPDGSIYSYGYTIVSNIAYLQTVTYPGVGTTTNRQYVYGEGTNGQAYQLTGIVDENTARFASWQYDSSSRAWLSVHGAATDTVDRVELTFTGDIHTSGSATVTAKQWIDLAGSTTVQRTYGFSRPLGVVKQGSVTLPCSSCGGAGGIASESYDSAGYPQSVVDFNTHTTNLTYDDTRGLETQRVEAVGTSSQRTTNTTWNTNFHVPDQRTIANTAGTEAKTNWIYNARGQVIARCNFDPADTSGYTCSATTAPLSSVKVRRWTYSYCDSIGTGCPLLGLLLSTDGPRLDVSDATSYSYYSTTDISGCSTLGGACHRLGDIWKITNAFGQVTTYISYDKNGRIARVQDTNGTYTDMTYHPRGWLLTRIVRANVDGSPNSTSDAKTQFDYDNVGNVTKVTDADRAYTKYTYDNAHRLTDVQDNLSNHVHYTLDAAGNRTGEQTYDPSTTLKRALTRQYDSLNHLTGVLNSAGAAVQTYTNPAEAPTHTNGYDGNGNAINSIDGTSNHVGTEQQYDPLNRLLKTLQDHAGTGATHDTTTQYAYDARDNLRSVIDPDGLTTSYTYDGLNNLTGLSSPDTGSTSYLYDAAGNRTSQTDARSITSTYTYDALNRLTGIAYPTTSLNVTYAYDQSNALTGCSVSYPVGRLTTMTDSSGSTTYCYDRRGNTTAVHQTTDDTTLIVAYGYSLGDRLASISYPSGNGVTYTRDAVGRITAISYTDSVSGIESAPLVSGVTYYPFGSANVITFGNGRTLSKTYDQDYAIDKVVSSGTGGLVIDASVDALGNVSNASSAVGASPPTQQYAYDPLYRLTTVQNGSGTSLLSLAYDATGDRTSKTDSGGTQTYAYPSPLTNHRLQSVAGTTRAYDAVGNTKTIGTATFTFDDRNRLSQAGAVTYDYNGRGERVIKNGTPDGGRRFIFTPTGQLLAEFALRDTCETDPHHGGCMMVPEWMPLTE